MQRSLWMAVIAAVFCLPAGVAAQGYQVNAAPATLTIDNVASNGTNPAVVNKSIVACPVGLSPTSGTFAFSTNVSGAFHDVVYNSAPLVPAGAGGITLPGGIVNLNLAGGLAYFNGPTLTLLPVPGSPFPGAQGASATVPFQIATPTDVSLQAVFTDPAAPAGYRLSQATEMHVGITAGVSTVAGPASDDSSVTVNVTAAPSCWTTSGIPFFGTVYTAINVSSNGRVLFGGADTDFSPSTAEAVGDNPFAGAWTDLNPSLGGSITISSPSPDVVRVDWLNVPYFLEPATANSFGIEFDASSGLVFLDGLTGIVPQPGPGSPTLTSGDDMFLGISPGNLLGATNAGATVFTSGGGGLAASSTSMTYDFFVASSGGGRAASLLPGTLGTIVFVPSASAVPNYDWAGL